MITTHVLDTAKGKPAAGVPVVLEIAGAGGQYSEVGRGETDADGRLRTLMKAGTLVSGRFRITFDTAKYFGNAEHFYPEVSIVFQVKDASSHFHVPLLLSPFGFSSYRGS